MEQYLDILKCKMQRLKTDIYFLKRIQDGNIIINKEMFQSHKKCLISLSFYFVCF